MNIVNNELIHENFKFKLITKILSLLLIFRTIQMAISYYYYQNGFLTEELFFTSFYLLILIGLFIGKKVHFFAVILIFIQYKFDDYYFSHNVSSNIVCFISFYLMLLSYNFEKLVKESISDTSFLKRINDAKYLIAFMWGILHFVSIFSHFDDVNWTSGKALGMILCNPYLSKFYVFFQNFNHSHTNFYLFLSHFFSYSFLVFQLIMLVFFAFKKTRILYFFWFFAFNLGVTFFINAAFLPHFSWLLFYLLIPKFKWSSIQILSYAKNIQLTNELAKTTKASFIVIGLFFLINFPLLKNITHKTFWVFREWDTYRYLDRKLTMVGLCKLNVFNSYQIANGIKWFTIYKQENNKWKKLPLIDTDGSRLSYFPDILHTVNHGSDFIFYANYFQYSCGIEVIDYSNSTTPYKLPGRVYERLIKYDKNRFSPNAKLYKVEFYSRTTDNPKFYPYKPSLDSVKYVRPLTLN